MRQKIKTLTTIFAVSFVLNLLWENAQAPLYQEYTSFAQHFWICLPASLWDAGYITLLYLTIALVRRDWFWVQKFPDREKSGPWIIVVIVVIGFFTATLIELRALAQGRWAYTSLMPLIPIIHVGFTPFIQLALLSLLTYTIIPKILKR